MRRRPAPRTLIGVRSKRLGYLVFATFAYGVFGISLVWAVLFLTGAGGPPLVDRGFRGDAPAAVAVDLALLGLFAIQHTLMARPRAKRALLRLVPAGAERSLFVLAASLILIVTFWRWTSLPQTVWSLTGPAALAVAVAAWLGWLGLIASTFMIDHLDLFGLRQGWSAFRARAYGGPEFRTRWLYGWVRHPMMTAFLVIFWAVPTMTLGHLLFAAAGTGYIAVGIWFEERDLRRAIPEYGAYRRRVGALVPKLR